MGVPRNHNQRKKVVSLRQKGKSLAQIGKILGVSRQRISWLLQTEGKMTADATVRTVTCPACLRKRECIVAMAAEEALCDGCLKPDSPFGERLRSLRLSAGLRRKDLERLSKVDSHAIRDFEEGKRLPLPRAAAKLESAMPKLKETFS